MNLQKIVAHIRRYNPIFQEVVSSADVDSLVERTNLQLPFASVNFLSDDAEDSSGLQNTFYLVVRESFEVIVVLDNNPFGGTSSRGTVAQKYAVGDVKKSLLSTLLFWRMDPHKSSKGLIYRGCHLVKMDRARIFYRFVFEQTIQLSYADGFPIEGTPLDEIDLTSNTAVFQADSTDLPIMLDPPPF